MKIKGYENLLLNGRVKGHLIYQIEQYLPPPKKKIDRY